MKNSLNLFGSAIYVVRERIASMIKAIILPSLLSVALETIQTQNSVFSLSLQIFNLMLYTYIAISIHRIVLIGSNSVATWGFKSWTRRESRFFIYIVGLLIIETVLMLAGFNLGLMLADFNLGGGLWMIPALIVGFLITARLSLVLPATAVDRRLSLIDSWVLTRGKTILVIMATLLWLIIFSVPIILIIWALSELGGAEVSTMLFEVLSELFYIFFITIAISSLSLTYLYIVGEENI